MLERVKTMLTNFRAKVEEEYQTAANAEGAAIESYNVEKARLESTIEYMAA